MADLKVKSGDPIKAKDWNRVIDLVSVSSVGNPSAVASLSPNLAVVKNSSGRDYDIGEVFYLDSFSGATANPPYEAIESPIYDCIEPVWHSKISRLCVSAEPIPDEEYGRAVLSGQCVIKTSSDSTDDWIMLDPATEYQGKPTTAGIARVLGKIADGWYMCNFGQGNAYWRYKLSEATQQPSTTTATLYTIGGTQFSTNTFELSDPLGISSGDAIDFEGYCIQSGNEFHIASGPCP